MKKSELYNQILNSVQESGSLERFKQHKNKSFNVSSAIDPFVTIFADVTDASHINEQRISVYIEIQRPANAYEHGTDSNMMLFKLDESQPFSDTDLYDVYQNNPEQFATVVKNAVVNQSEKIKVVMDNRDNPYAIPFKEL